MLLQYGREYYQKHNDTIDLNHTTFSNIKRTVILHNGYKDNGYKDNGYKDNGYKNKWHSLR